MKMFRTTAAAGAIAASLVSVNASAVNVATDGIGEVGIIPYYTANEGWQTLFSVTNTTADAVVVKVRFREGANSREVLDFNVALSAYDVFSGYVGEGKPGTPNEGLPTFFISDDPNDDIQPDGMGATTCVTPVSMYTDSRTVNNGTALRDYALPGTDDDRGYDAVDTYAAANADRMAEGYIEIITLGYTPMSGSGATVVGTDIRNHDCGAIDDAFKPNLIVDTAQQFGEPTNSIKVSFRLLHSTIGFEAAGSATTLANFFNPGAFEGETTNVNLMDGLVTPADNAACTITRGHERVDAAGDGNRDFRWIPGLNATASAFVTPGYLADNAASCQNLITAQSPYMSSEPSLNDAFPQIASWWSDTLNVPVSVYPQLPTLNDEYPGFFGGPGFPISGGVVTSYPEEARGVDAVSLALQAGTVVNEWSNRAPGYGPSAGGVFDVRTTWVVTFPTKRYYSDQGFSRHHAIMDDGAAPDDVLEAALFDFNLGIDNADSDVLQIEEDWLTGAALAEPGYMPFGQRQKATTCEDVYGGYGVNVAYRLFDRAEQSDPTQPSPAITLDQQLCNEVNLLTFVNSDVPALDGLDDRSALKGASSILDTAVDVAPIQDDVTKAADFQNDQGWMSLIFAETDTTFPERYIPATADFTNYSVADYGTFVAAYGLPAVGYSLRTREVSLAGSEFRNTAALVPHAITRNIIEPGTLPASTSTR